MQYVEAHGTGTSLGRPDRSPCSGRRFSGADARRRIRCTSGSVKTNIGHLEAAAGVAGVIKTVLACNTRRIPASLHFPQLNPHIDLKGAPLVVPAQAMPWPAAGRRIAGVSSFGFSGTNAHVILEEAPVRARAAGAGGSGPTCWCSRRARRPRCRTWHAVTRHISQAIPTFRWAICATPRRSGRNRFECVLALSGPTVAELRGQTRQVAEGREDAGSCRRPAAPRPVTRSPCRPIRSNGSGTGSRRARRRPRRSTTKWASTGWSGSGSRIRRGRTARLPAVPPDFARRGLQAIGDEGGLRSSMHCSREHGLDRYVELRPELDRSELRIHRARVARVRLESSPGEIGKRRNSRRAWASGSDTCGRSGRMLEILGEEGVLERAGAVLERCCVYPRRPIPDADFPLLARRLSAIQRRTGFSAAVRRGPGERAARADGSAEPAVPRWLVRDGRGFVREIGRRQGVSDARFSRPCCGRWRRFRRAARSAFSKWAAAPAAPASYVARVLPPERVEYTVHRRFAAVCGARRRKVSSVSFLPLRGARSSSATRKRRVSRGTASTSSSPPIAFMPPPTCGSASATSSACSRPEGMLGRCSKAPGRNGGWTSASA